MYPGKRTSSSDRDCPVDTAHAHCLWHAGGTAGENDEARTCGDGSQLAWKGEARPR